NNEQLPLLNRFIKKIESSLLMPFVTKISVSLRATWHGQRMYSSFRLIPVLYQLHTRQHILINLWKRKKSLSQLVVSPLYLANNYNMYKRKQTQRLFISRRKNWLLYPNGVRK